VLVQALEACLIRPFNPDHNLAKTGANSLLKNPKLFVPNDIIGPKPGSLADSDIVFEQEPAKTVCPFRVNIPGRVNPAKGVPVEITNKSGNLFQGSLGRFT